jgi:ATP-dependent Zn protease
MSALSNRSRSEDRRVAFHEAGHIVAYLSFGQEVSSATIEQDKDAAGQIAADHIEWWEGNRADRATCTRAMICCQSGAVAEAMGTGDWNGMGGDDLSHMVEIICRLLADEKGLTLNEDDDVLDSEFCRKHEREIEEEMSTCEFETHSLLERNWDKVKALAAALLNRRTLNRDEIQRIWTKPTNRRIQRAPPESY